MTFLESRMSESLDRWITGNYGEDQCADEDDYVQDGDDYDPDEEAEYYADSELVGNPPEED
jgi:hypothetical protein